MEQEHIALLVEDTYHYLDDLEACLSGSQFEHLERLQELYEHSITSLKALPAEQSAAFSTDIAHFMERLNLLRDVMEAHAQAIHTQLSGMGQTSKAAKAYTKSGLVSTDETE